MGFKEKCILNLSELPSSPCKNGIRQILTLPTPDLVQKHTLTPEEMAPVSQGGLQGCPWYIIDEDANFCFWKFQANPVNHSEHTQEMISVLLGTSIPNIFACEQQAYNRIRKMTRRNDLKNNNKKSV